MRTTLPGLLAANRQFKENPSAVYDIGVWPPETWDYADFRGWFRGCLNDKINRNDSRNGWRKMTAEYQNNLLWDRRAVENYLIRRIRSSGSGVLRTSEMRQRYPFVNNQPFEND